MIVLAIDTAGPECAACIYDDSSKTTLAKASESIGRGHAEHLPGIVLRVLNEASLGFRDISLLTVTEGPGSFAGIRVGISYVRALALALGIPAIGVSSLEGVLQSIPAEESARSRMAVLDARRGEVYVMAIDHGGALIQKPAAIKIDDTPKLLAGKSWILCGNGVEKIEPLSREHKIDYNIANHIASPPVEIVAKIGLDSKDGGVGPKPQYLRAADAKPQSNFALDRQ